MIFVFVILLFAVGANAQSSDLTWNELKQV